MRPLIVFLDIQGTLGVEVVSEGERSHLESPMLHTNLNKIFVSNFHNYPYIVSDTPGLGPSLVVHTSVPFGLEHLENDKDAIQPIILQELQRLLPDLPQPVSIKFQKWRYSQVLTSVPNCPGHMTILEQPLLICGGDAFTHSNFDGCVESALSVCRALQLLLDVKQNISL
uniref:Amine oxidase domain-containing protein n=1 Tax=Xiphophorus couchianus TaxID=32473 RepID=A0A3B5KMC8_9TELE